MSKAVSQTRTSAQGITAQTTKIENAFSGLKKTIGGLAIGAGLVKLGKEAISVASDIQEVQNVVDVAFGNMTWKVEKFAQNSIEQFGMSELSAKRTASTYMAMAKGMGLDPDVASDMSIALAGLTGDVASFYNISQELADTKLKSVFTGETETLKDLGIVMTQTNLQQYALSQGIQENVSDMNQAQLTTLRYNYVLSQLSMAQGDFSRTSGSWANQLRILQEQFKQLLGIIGNGLITVLTPVITILNTVISKVIYFANVLSAVFGKLFGKKTDTSTVETIGNDADNAAKSVGNITKALDNTGKQAKKTSKEIKGVLAPFDDLNVLSSSNGLNDDGTSAGSSSGSAGTGGGYDVGTIDWGDTFNEPDTSGIEAAVDKVMGYVEKLRNFIDENGAVIVSILAGIAGAFLAFETIKWWGTLTSGISGIIALISEWQLGLADTIAVLTGIPTPIMAVVTAVGAITAALVYLYQTSEDFRNLVNDAVSSTLGLLNNLYKSCLKPIFDFLGDVYKTVLEPIVSLIADVFVTIIGTVSSILLSLYNNIIVPLGNFLINVFGKAIEGVIEVFKFWLEPIKSLISVLTNLWNNALKPVAEFITGTFCKAFEEAKKILEPILQGIEDLFSGFIDIVVGILTLNPEKIEEGLGEVCGVFEGAVSSIKGFLADIPEKITTTITAVKDKAFDIAVSAYNAVKNSEAVKTIKGTIANAFNTVKNAFNGLKSNTITKTISGVVKSAFNTAKNAFNAVKSNSVTKTFKGVQQAAFKTAVSVWKSVKSVTNTMTLKVKDLFTATIKRMWNGIATGINGAISIINKIPGVKISKIPKLAQGGIATSATLGIFGEAGTEAVIPLKRNTQGLEMIAEKLAERLPEATESTGGTYIIYLTLPTGEKITKWIIKNINDYKIKTGKEVF